MAMKIISPAGLKLPRNPLHTVRFVSDDTRYKSLEHDSILSALGHQYPAPDSGAPSPDTGPIVPAHQLYGINEQRIKLLTAINQIVHQRAQLEDKRQTLSNLLDDLRRKLRRRVDECHSDKREQLKSLKQMNLRLEKEKFSLKTELEHLQRHLEKEEAHHVQHARTAAAQAIQGVTRATSDKFFSSCSVAQLPALVSRNVARNAPSKLSDNKLAAARLMRDIAELRQRVAQVEAKLANELKRKRQAEIEITRLRKQLSAAKCDVAGLRLPSPQIRRWE